MWIGETTSRLGGAVTTVALPLLAVTELEASPFLMGVLSAAAYLPWLLLSLHAGAWVDRTRKRPIMLACNLASSVLLASVPLAAWTGTLTLTQLVAVAFLTGCTTVLFVTAYRAYVPVVVQKTHLVEANARLQGGEQVAQIAGRGLGGLLAQILGAAGAILADVVSFAVSTWCLARIPTSEVAPAPTEKVGIGAQIAAGLRFTAADPHLRTLGIFSAAGNLAFTGLQTLLIVFLVRDVGATPGLVGLLAATLSIGGIAGAAAAPWSARRFGNARAMLLWSLGTGPFALLIPLTFPGPGLLLVAAGTIATGAGLVAITVIMISFRQTYVPTELFARVNATMNVANYAAVPFGTLAAGALGSALGNRNALWVIAALFVGYGAVVLASPMRTLRDLPSVAQVPSRQRR